MLKKTLKFATGAKCRLFNMAEQAILQTYDCNSTASKCPKNIRHSARCISTKFLNQENRAKG